MTLRYVHSFFRAFKDPMLEVHHVDTVDTYPLVMTNIAMENP